MSLNDEEMRLKSLRANTHPSRLTELESVNETLQYWQNQFEAETFITSNSHDGVKLLEKAKPRIMIWI